MFRIQPMPAAFLQHLCFSLPHWLEQKFHVNLPSVLQYLPLNMNMIASPLPDHSMLFPLSPHPFPSAPMQVILFALYEHIARTKGNSSTCSYAYAHLFNTMKQRCLFEVLKYLWTIYLFIYFITTDNMKDSKEMNAGAKYVGCLCDATQNWLSKFPIKEYRNLAIMRIY